MKFAFIGSPGSGYEDWIPLLTERYNVCHISSRDMVLRAIREESDSGKRAKASIDAGKGVNEDLGFEILAESMRRPECKDGYVLDGVPGNISQAYRLEKMGEKLDAVVKLSVPDEIVVEINSGRWIHATSGRVYHDKYDPPKEPGFDDDTGEPLQQKKSDRKEVVEERLKLFHENMSLVDAYYSKRELLHFVDGHQEMEKVKDQLFKCLDPFRKGQSWFKSFFSGSK